MRKRKSSVRRCRCCGEPMPPVRLWVCEICQMQGRTVRLPETLNGAELETVARARQECGLNPLDEMTLEEVTVLAWTYRREGYGSYGKLRGYVHMTGRLPERKRDNA